MRKNWWPVLTAVLVFAVLAGAALAQEGGGGEVEIQKKSWLDLFKATGVVGILMLILSIVGTALLIQFSVNMTEPKLYNAAVMSEIESMLAENNIDDAASVAGGDSSYAGRVIAGGLSRYLGGYEEVKAGTEESATVEYAKLNAKLSYLSLVGNIGPLMGLLGTVTGMISSFQVIEQKKAPTPADLAVGVYESLVNTTMGLFIAIVFLTAYFFLKNRVSEVVNRINIQISELLSLTLAPEVKHGK